MTSRYEAYMNGVALSSIDPSIYVLNIQPGEVRKEIRTSKVSGMNGARVTKKIDESTSVNILFEIHEYDTVKRQAICQKIQKWADGDTLSVSDRPDQFLRCVCETYPVANAKEWTEPLTVGFVAYTPPYWQDRDETSVEVTNATEDEDSKTLYVPGNAPVSLVSCDITAGESITLLKLTVGGTEIKLTGLSVLANSHIYVGYDENNLIYIMHNSTSILNKRTSDSSDDLQAICGEFNTFSVYSDGDVDATYSVRGCWY